MLTNLLLIFTGSADEPDAYLVRLHGAAGGLVGGPQGVTDALSAGGFLSGRITVHGERAALEAAAREGLLTEDTRSAGALFFGARFTSAETVYWRVGFAHNHETPIAVFSEDPLGGILGSAEGIRHRSGLEVGGGLSLPTELALFGLADRLALHVDGGISWLVDDNGPPLYVCVELGGHIGVGQRR
ncbi:MAG: hypothetical protein P8R54_14955 [Myxococcota bacterium]|nr:hypothetical protein [Myxococcota bacterium]